MCRTATEGPDRGWAWVITGAGFFINFATFGFVRLSGVFYVSLRESFVDISREQAARPFSLSVTCHTLLGPVIGLLCRRLGNRPVALIGAVLTSSGVSLCYIAPSITWITLFIGALFGVGFGMVAIALQITINQYFVKMRATASGLSFSGGCMSSFILPVTVEALTDFYGVHGAFLILGGLILNTLVATSLFRPPPWLAHPPTAVPKDRDKVYTISKSKDAANLPPKDAESGVQEALLSPTVSNNNKCETPQNDKEKVQGSNSPGHKTDLDCQSITVAVVDTQPPQHDTAAKTPGFLDAVKDVTSHPIFYLISITVALFFFAFFIFLTTIVDFAIDRGVPETKGKFMLSAYALGDLVGRLGLGWVTDRGFVKRRNFIMANMIAIGGSVLLLSFAYSFTTLAISAVCYGVSSGSVIVMFPVLVGHYLPMEHQSLALGGVYFFNGLLVLAVPPTIGHFRDVVGSYVPLLYLLSVLVAFAGLLWLSEPWLLKRYNEKKMSRDYPIKA